MQNSPLRVGRGLAPAEKMIVFIPNPPLRQSKRRRELPVLYFSYAKIVVNSGDFCFYYAA